MPAREHRIIAADLLSPDIYARERDTRRRDMIPVKRDRRIEVGPFVTFYFENFATMLAQVQEMLHIERGGEAQVAGELETYNPLIPQGSELIATMMIEIDEPARRAATLLKLGGIEESVWMQVGPERVAASPADYADRTTPDGKTSSVHWLRFRFTPEQINRFRNPAEPVVLGIGHENYGHMASVSPEKRTELAKDFD
ncbi:MAG TPA: DUF3501 family protein [Micropepsaceae bacterium]|nr:DUF3501 family protein [Micropepsaceae bacterium]